MDPRNKSWLDERSPVGDEFRELGGIRLPSRRQSVVAAPCTSILDRLSHRSVYMHAALELRVVTWRIPCRAALSRAEQIRMRCHAWPTLDSWAHESTATMDHLLGHAQGRATGWTSVCNDEVSPLSPLDARVDKPTIKLSTQRADCVLCEVSARNLEDVRGTRGAKRVDAHNRDG